MENTSKALMMAGEIMIGVLILTLLAVAFHEGNAFTQTVNTNIQKKVISEFNIKFDKYREKSDLTAQDVITIVNLANECTLDGYEVSVSLSNVETAYRNPCSLNDEQKRQFIINNSYNSTTNSIIYFECQSMEFNGENGRINKIIIKKL